MSGAFHGKTDFERMLAVVRGDYALPSDLIPGHPRELEQVIGTALATDPARRFASAQALCEALERVAVARGWALGTGAIQRTMHALFGDVPEPWTSCADDAPVTEPHAVASLPRSPSPPGRRAGSP